METMKSSLYLRSQLTIAYGSPPWCFSVGDNECLEIGTRLDILRYVQGLLWQLDEATTNQRCAGGNHGVGLRNSDGMAFEEQD